MQIPGIRSKTCSAEVKTPTNSADEAYSYGYATAWSFAELIRRCGDDLTRDNLMRQATSLKGVTNPMLLPGITLNTSPTDYHPVKQLQMLRFDGKHWVRFGEVIGTGRD